MFRAHRPILRRVHTAVHTTIGSDTEPMVVCVNSPEDGPVGPKHVEIRLYINKIEIVTSVGFYSIDATASRVYYLTFMCDSTCFGRFHAHHRELKTALAASGFTVGAWW